MERPEARQAAPLVLAECDRIAIIAGSGRLPAALFEQVCQSSKVRPLLVAIAGEADDALAVAADRVMTIEEIGKLGPYLKKEGVTHTTFAGGVSRRPAWYRFFPAPGILKLLPRAIRALGSGDDALLRIVTAYADQYGITVLGAHQLMPQLLAPEGTIGRVQPDRDDWIAIRAAWVAARAIGALDIGQAAIAFGSRAVALEGIEGTEGLLERTAAMRHHGRLNSSRRGVLVKCCKPGQDTRMDLPSIGPQTVVSAHAAGLSGVAVEACLSLMLDIDEIRREADRLGLFVIGVSEAML